MCLAPFLVRLGLAALLVPLAGCAQIGTIKVLGAYVMGEGTERRELNAGVEIALREPARRQDGKTLIRAAKPLAFASPAEPICSPK